jgi:hypothetical protein
VKKQQRTKRPRPKRRADAVSSPRESRFQTTTMTKTTPKLKPTMLPMPANKSSTLLSGFSFFVFFFFFTDGGIKKKEI